jgi:hypothetical protein
VTPGGLEFVFEVAQIFEESDFSDFFNNPENNPPIASNKNKCLSTAIVYTYLVATGAGMYSLLKIKC